MMATSLGPGTKAVSRGGRRYVVVAGRVACHVLDPLDVGSAPWGLTSSVGINAVGPRQPLSWSRWERRESFHRIGLLLAGICDSVSNAWRETIQKRWINLGKGVIQLALRIERIETIPIKVPLKHVYKGSYYQMGNRCTIITRVYTDEGIIGEIYNGDADEEQPEIVRIIQEELAPRVIGMDAFNVEACWQAMLPITFDQLRDRRFAIQAVACVDSAIWDAIGKALGQPLYRIWGGYRSSLPMIGIGGYYTGETSVEEDVEFFASQGMAGMKFKVGGRTPEVDLDRLRRAVAVAPKGFVFVVDANQGYTLREAIDFAQRAKDVVPLRWFEEPCRWLNDLRAMKDVRALTGVPVAAGQSEISRRGMRELITEGSIDVSNFDASWGGGPTEWRKVAMMAELYDVELGHHEEAQVASHLLAARPNGTYVEGFRPERDPIYWQMLENRPSLEEGGFKLPERPGFGWQFDQDFINLYRVDR